jgi:histone H3/H4
MYSKTTLKHVWLCVDFHALLAAENVIAAASVVDDVDNDGHSSMGKSSLDLVLPLDAVQSLLVPECKGQVDTPDCAWETINQCITEATVRLAFESANIAALDKRKVITAEDVNRAIDELHDKDPDPGRVIQEMNAVVTANKKAAEARLRQESRIRNNTTAAEGRKKKAIKEQEEAVRFAKLDLSSTSSRN